MSDELWCVHVQGPDSLIAMPSKEIAELRATEWNAMFDGIKTAGGRKSTEFDPIMTAMVTLWPLDAASHAADLVAHGGNPEDIC